MSIPIFQIDAFAMQAFSGNPAAVCPLPHWPSDAWMQNVAMENNLSETAFFVARGDHYDIRWFTPTCEVDLCGHATVASAFVLWTYLGCKAEEIVFKSASGPLQVSHRDGLIELNFPARASGQEITLESVLGQSISEALKCEILFIAADQGRCLVQLKDSATLTELQPNIHALTALPYSVFLVTAKGDTEDFVCRVFAPQKGIDEDPVTGSAYTILSPFWGKKLGKSSLHARQLSKRGGLVQTHVKGDRVLIAGSAVCVMRGELLLSLDV